MMGLMNLTKVSCLHCVQWLRILHSYPFCISWLFQKPHNVTSTPGHVLTTSLLRPKKIKDVVRTWYGLVGRGRDVVLL